MQLANIRNWFLYLSSFYKFYFLHNHLRLLCQSLSIGDIFEIEQIIYNCHITKDCQINDYRNGDYMNLLSATTPKTFSLLSIGQRGVGKTVFLAGSYAELHPDNHPDNSQQMWFDCQDSNVQANLEKIKKHVARTGQYPPPTIRITNFNFSLKRQSVSGAKTLCNFRWWDIPGEFSNIVNPAFQDMIFSTNSCCVFINAHALIQDPDYPRVLEDIFNQVAAIASVISKYNVKYAFALILTKCDLIELNSATQQRITKKLEPLTTYLDNLKATHQTFYSAIPIVSLEGVSRLQAKGAATPLLWILSQLNDAHEQSFFQTLSSRFTQIFMGQGLSLKTRRSILIMSLVSVSFVGAIASLLLVLNLLRIFPQQMPIIQQSPNPTQQNDIDN